MKVKQSPYYGPKQEVHVERQVIWNVVITHEEFGRKEWPHYTEQEAVRRADHMYDVNLASERGDDKL
jgi:hypothetical protein